MVGPDLPDGPHDRSSAQHQQTGQQADRLQIELSVSHPATLEAEPRSSASSAAGDRVGQTTGGLPMHESERGLVLRLRSVLAAPRARIFQALTTPADLAAWWGPEGFSTTEMDLDLRVGGRYRFTMSTRPTSTDEPSAACSAGQGLFEI